MTTVEKKYRLNSWCEGQSCDTCILTKQTWEHKSSDDCSCLYFDDATPEEIEKAYDIVFKGDGLNVEFTAADETVVNDPVNKASHYNNGGIECIDAIAASMPPTEYAGFLKGQVFKYIWRYRLKGKPVEDLKKARYYLDRLIQITEREEVKV